MTVKELYDSIKIKSSLRILSAYNGKILCYEYKPHKHVELGEREIVALWSDIVVQNFSYGHSACPVLCMYVDGRFEYEKERSRDTRRSD